MGLAVIQIKVELSLQSLRQLKTHFMLYMLKYIGILNAGKHKTSVSDEIISNR